MAIQILLKIISNQQSCFHLFIKYRKVGFKNNLPGCFTHFQQLDEVRWYSHPLIKNVSLGWHCYWKWVSLLEFWNPRKPIHVSGRISTWHFMGFLNILNLHYIVYIPQPYYKKSPKISGTCGSSLGITNANKYCEHTFYRKQMWVWSGWELALASLRLASQIFLPPPLAQQRPKFSF